MAKGKKEEEAEKPKRSVNDADLAEFMAALDSDDNQAVDGGTNDTKNNKKIVVQEETPSIAKRRRGPVASDTPELDQVLSPDPSGEMGQMTKSQRHFPWGWVVGIVALLAVVSVAGFFFFNKAKKFGNTNVQLNFKPIAAVVSGSRHHGCRVRQSDLSRCHSVAQSLQQRNLEYLCNRD